MAKYIKQEVPDLHKTGEQKVFYRLKTERNVDFGEFVRMLCAYHSGITRGEALRVLIAASETLAELLAKAARSVWMNGAPSRLPSVWNLTRRWIPSTEMSPSTMPVAFH